MTCYNCGEPTHIPILFQSRRICSACFPKLNPPLLLLVKYWVSSTLYDPLSNSYIPKTVKSLEQCGFFLHNHKVFLSKTGNETYREVFIFRYFGKVACRLISNHVWHENMSMCTYLPCQ